MSRENLIRFSNYVRENPELEARLQSAPDQTSLVKLSVEEGGESFGFNEEDVYQWLEHISTKIELTYPIVNIDRQITANIFF